LSETPLAERILHRPHQSTDKIWVRSSGVVDPKKAVSSRESHGNQELSRVNEEMAPFRP
jgi:hypothetical protein